MIAYRNSAGRVRKLVGTLVCTSFVLVAELLICGRGPGDSVGGIMVVLKGSVNSSKKKSVRYLPVCRWNFLLLVVFCARGTNYRGECSTREIILRANT